MRLAIALISAGALGYEILLMRLFSIIQWHHFAYMMISLALLGYGASGSFLVLARGVLLPRFGHAFAASAFLFGLSATLCFLAARNVPFNALEILWSPREWGRLVLIYVILVPPFFFAANCIGLAFQRYRDSLGRVYAADLGGAGGGALAIILLLFVWSPLDALVAVSGLGGAGAALAWTTLDLKPRAAALALLAGGPLLAVLLHAGGAELQPVEYKGLAQALRAVGAERIEERSSPLGLLTVVRSPVIPFRHAPGLSLNSPIPVPEQLAVFTDGDAMSVINRWHGSREELAFLDWVPSALPYHLLPPKPKVLVLGAGGGSEVLQGIFHGAARIDAVELNPQMIDLVSRRYADFAGHLYQRPEVRVHVAEARGYVAASAESYDLIQLALVDAFSSAGLHGLNESYLYTVEALQTYLAHLKPGGFLALTRWVRLPPRDEAKLFATAALALERSGEADPGRRLVWIRGWQTSTLLVRNGAIGDADIALLRRFCAERAFDPAWHPGLREADTNVHNVLKRPYLFETATALLGPGRQGFVERYKFDIRPATDDRPYFFHFFRPALWSEALALRGAGGLALLELGYPVLVATLVQAALISALLILAPLKAFGQGGGAQGRRTTAVLAYFLGVGLAFMFLEMAYIQKFILYLAHPLYAVAAVLAGFLLFAGLGSRKAGAIPRERTGASLTLAVKCIAGISLAYLLLLPPLFQVSMALPGAVKLAAALLLIAPLAFFMGMPFPLGLARLTQGSDALIPWAFGINGCASVIAAILATLLSIHIGQTGLLVSAVALYAVAAWISSRVRPPGAG